jgi:predicted helicase
MSLALKPTHATVKAYYETLHQYGQLHIDHEGAVRSAFQELLAKSGRKAKPQLTLVPEYRIERARGSSVIVDGALVDLYHLPHGYWEAKDEKDDLLKEVQLKLDKGYPRDNIIFQAPERAILYQGGARILDENISKPEPLVQIVNQFFDYKAPHIQEWEQAVEDFSERIPELAAAVKKTIDEERRRNPAFVRSFDEFYALCRQAINPNLSEEAVERMLVQHLLTERIFRKIFDNPDFTRRNVVAAEIEKVINELTKRAFNRDEFLGNLDRFYKAIEQSAESASSFSEKQAFLNKVYERFFQGYFPREADTHGIVYTPQPIVNFMVRSVEEILRKEFGRSLGDKGVHILDPFVGTGNFIVRIMQEIKATDLQYKYENELHCNEVMLLPYYIASMNIEHAYFDRTDEYKPFPGICLVDTFELTEPKQPELFTEENTQRVERQKQSDIFVIVGNPPYNSKQVDENDNNQNRRYPALDRKVADTYGADSAASTVIKLNDPYVKAIRWATDRLGTDGIVAFIANASFVDQIAFDGMRLHLARDFERIYLFDLGGNIRKNPDLSGTTHNVFGIKVGVTIVLLVRKSPTGSGAEIYRYETARELRREQRFAVLENFGSASHVDWKRLPPDARHSWITDQLAPEYAELLPLGSKQAKAGHSDEAVFESYTLGVNTARDAWAYNFQPSGLEISMRRTINTYNEELDRWSREKADGKSLMDVVSKDEKLISWSEGLKNLARRGVHATYSRQNIRPSLYRPYTKQYLYFDPLVIERRYQIGKILPVPATCSENLLLCTTGAGAERPFASSVANEIPNLNFYGPGTVPQWFPFYTYAEDGSNRRENITDWALEQFRARYHDPSISKWDIFHYIYAVLHHPEYRERYAANLRRELPRIPFVSASPPALSSRAERDRPKDDHAQLRDPASAGTRQGTGREFPARGSPGPAPGENASRQKEQTPGNSGSFGSVNGLASESIRYAQDDSVKSRSEKSLDLGIFRAFVKAGERLAEIHVQYEKQAEYPLTKTEKAGEKLDWRVTKMRLSKDKATLIYNQFLGLSGIPPETYEYRLGNRSALEWVIDQYQVSTDKRSGITNDPNRADDPQYVLRLIGQVITVSLETVKVVGALLPLGLPA